MNKFFFRINWFLLINICVINLFIFADANSNEKLNLISIGKDSAPVKIKIYSSLTCPHCAKFHFNVLPKIQEKYVKTGKVKIIFIDFPLDLAALNASKILHCVEKNKQILIMNLIYEKQSQWAVGSDMDEINNRLREIVTTTGINLDKINKCFFDENIENGLLNARIEGHKKYSISSTPTIIINEKKLSGSNSFENIEKEIKKNI